MATHNFKAKIFPKWALLTAKFWGDFGFSLNDISIDAYMHKFTKICSHPVYVYCYFCLKCRTFCKLVRNAVCMRSYFATPRDDS